MARAVCVTLLLLSPLPSAAVRRQLPAGSCVAGLGQAASSACTTATGSSCSQSTPGSTAYASWSGVSYSTSTGKFSGSLIHNGCPHDTRAWSQSSVAIPWKTGSTPIGGPGTATCCSSTFPATNYGTAPKTVPAFGIAGISMFGEDVYGYGDAGFNSATQNLCTTGTGGCPANSDVDTCQAFAEATCGTSDLKSTWFMSDCGGNFCSPRSRVCLRLLLASTALRHPLLCRPRIAVALPHESDLRAAHRHDVGVAFGVGRALDARRGDARWPRPLRPIRVG